MTLSRSKTALIKYLFVRIILFRMTLARMSLCRMTFARKTFGRMRLKKIKSIMTFGKIKFNRHNGSAALQCIQPMSNAHCSAVATVYHSTGYYSGGFYSEKCYFAEQCSTK